MTPAQSFRAIIERIRVDEIEMYEIRYLHALKINYLHRVSNVSNVLSHFDVIRITLYLNGYNA